MAAFDPEPAVDVAAAAAVAGMSVIASLLVEIGLAAVVAAESAVVVFAAAPVVVAVVVAVGTPTVRAVILLGLEDQEDVVVVQNIPADFDNSDTGAVDSVVVQHQDWETELD